MIYNETIHDDLKNIYHYINHFTKELGVEKVQIDTDECFQVVINYRKKFPYVDGIEESSTFKKVSNFVCFFLSKRPIKTVFPDSATKELSKYDPNAIIAFDIAIACLEGSTITLEDGGDRLISANITLSDHSYYDILDALSSIDINPKNHFKLLAVFFEQLTYKCNPDCEYDSSRYYPRLDDYDLSETTEELGL